MISEIENIISRAHIDTVHPGSIAWPEDFDNEEMDFLSCMAFGEPGHHHKAVPYVVKELSQLAEIEKHVTGVMSIILSELQAEQNHEINSGHYLHDALSCFAAEELHHANMFYKYVRLLGRKDIKYPDNLYAQRVGLYQGTDSVWVKLAALCCSAYIGESVITAFENRCRAIDPDLKHYFTKLLTVHGLDEARHIKIDHFVFERVVPNLTAAEKRRMMQITNATEDLNTELSIRFGKYIKELFSIEYTEGNIAHETQMQLTAAFRKHVFGGAEVRQVDNELDESVKGLLSRFSLKSSVHGLTQASA